MKKKTCKVTKTTPQKLQANLIYLNEKGLLEPFLVALRQVGDIFKECENHPMPTGSRMYGGNKSS